MNDVLASELSTGCESGWTLYLEHSFLPPYSSHRGSEFVESNGAFTEEKREKDEDEEEEEDSSMVSDASSGPPHFHEDENYGHDNNGCFYNAPTNPTLKKNSGKKQKFKEHRHQKVQEQSSFLDDTASSPLFNFSNNNYTLTNNQASMENILDFSQGYSANHFEESSVFHGHFGCLQSSVSGNQLQQNQLKVLVFASSYANNA
ncbi:hypothetical protein F0562_020786 [Nyssa sinensis]|uniref:Uncharacterized protein n=1 Tax=Nyssa sinensis TaxID=561372 RepID=A0A5J5BRM6_9ASTE|nr:hypothetical protein F0562_020786 [Nyssa sinensis]